MAASLSYLSLFSLFTVIASFRALADRVLEDGYSVTTVLDGNKLGLNPHSLLPRPGSPADYVILDSKASSFFSVSFPKSQESVTVKRFAGNGLEGFSDGELASSMFKEPRSFAVDLKGNVYVADQFNHVIRKISNSGVTTIAGGYSQTTGKMDGPAQNATFSDDFGLTFIPERCALMISDHGSQLVRQIDLKLEDCAKGSESVLGTTSAWVLGLGVSCLLGLVIGFAVQPYITRYEGRSPLHHKETWKHCLISLERQVAMLCFDTRSVIVNSTLYPLLRRLVLLSLSHISLMFRTYMVKSKTTPSSGVKTVSLLDSDVLASDGTMESETTYVDQLKDLLLLDTTDGRLESSQSTDEVPLIGESNEGNHDTISLLDKRVNYMIKANMVDFVAQAGKTSQDEFSVRASGVVKRR